MQFERYGLSSAPFHSRGDAAFIAVPSRVEPLERIQQALVDGHGIVLLTSNSGLGKSTLCRELQRRSQDDWLVALLQDCGCTTRRSLLQAILYELGLPYAGLSEQEARLRMFDAIRDRQPDQQGLLLLVDEAQRLNDRLLEELRSLANHDVDGRPLIRLLLCGDLVLEERLITPGLADLNQRVVCHESLLPLSCEESAQLVDGKIVRAGGDGWEHVYTRSAMELLCLVSDGSPRNLEQLANRSLQIADRAREPRVSVESLRTGLNELKELPLQWNEPANLDAYVDDAAEEAGDIVDLRSGLAEDDAISVHVGDELPDPVEIHAAAAVIEFGSESTAAREVSASASQTPLDELFTRGRHEPNVLLEEATATGLAETAVIELGSSTSALDDSDEVDDRPDWEQDTVVVRGAAASLPMIAPAPPSDPSMPSTAPAWIELEVDDRYAALDADVPTPPVRRSEPVSISSKSAPPDVPTTTLPIDLELTILKQVGEIRDDVSSRLQLITDDSPETTQADVRPSDLEPANGRSSGLGVLPEWDVIQPEWVSHETFTPVPIQDPRDQLTVELQSIAAQPPANECPNDVDAAVACTENAEPCTGADRQEPDFAASLEVCSVEPRFHIEQRRTDEGHQRPYAQLFSRLRKLRSQVGRVMRR